MFHTFVGTLGIFGRGEALHRFQQYWKTYLAWKGIEIWQLDGWPSNGWDSVIQHNNPGIWGERYFFVKSVLNPVQILNYSWAYSIQVDSDVKLSQPISVQFGERLCNKILSIRFSTWIYCLSSETNPFQSQNFWLSQAG